MWILRVLRMGIQDRGDVSLLERFNLLNQLLTLLLSTAHAADVDLHSAVLHVLHAMARALGDSAFEHLVLKRGLLFALSRLVCAYRSSEPLPLSEASAAPDRTPERSLLARLLLRLLLAERRRLRQRTERAAPLLLYRQCDELAGVLSVWDAPGSPPVELPGEPNTLDGVSLPETADSAIRRRTARKLLKRAVARCKRVFSRSTATEPSEDETTPKRQSTDNI